MLVDLLPSLTTLVVTLIGAVGLFRLFSRVNHHTLSLASLLEIHEPSEAALEWEEGEVLESPSIHDPNDKLSIICYDPATGRKLGVRRAATPTQVLEAVDRARSAQVEFGASSFQLRRSILNTLLDWIIEHQDMLCRVSARDTGKTFLDATFGELLPLCEKLKWTMNHGEMALMPEHRPSGSISFMTSARVEYVPVGVMGVIVSWNYCIQNILSPLISALFSGNGCVIKCSEHTAWSASFLQNAIHAILKAHNVNTDLVTLVNGWADAGETLVETADKIIFIGSPGVGKLVMKKASETLTPVVLELGGKDAAIVFDDCEYKSMLDICIRGSFQNCGQNCAGLERMIVQEGKTYDRLIADLTRIVGDLRLGSAFDDEVDLGAITMKHQIKIVQELVDDAVAKGATVHCGGKVFYHPDHPKGQFFSPTVLSNVTPAMRIHTEEVFGPVMLVYKFKTAAEAISITNATGFGLSSSVFSLDYVKAERVLRQLHVGMTNVNGWVFNYLCGSLPFGGVKKSGFDRFGGVEGLRGCCHIRSATTDRFKSIGLRTSVPELLNFPISKTSYQFQTALAEVIYGNSLVVKFAGVRKIVKITIFGSL